MGSFVLTRRSVIICPHGGIVTHVPTSFRNYTVNGEMVLLLTDQYVISGCPFHQGPCVSLVWTAPSATLHVNGVPALVHTSVGITQGMSPGPVVITSFQTMVKEPDSFTNVS